MSELIRGMRHQLPNNRSIFVSIDPLENPRAKDGTGYAVSFEVDSSSVSDLNLSGETIEALYRTYKKCKSARRKTAWAWSYIVSLTATLERRAGDGK